ncbi:MAG: endolytic transglycosylase MltG [Patescibacteria group bacterium]
MRRKLKLKSIQKTKVFALVIAALFFIGAIIFIDTLLIPASFQDKTVYFQINEGESLRQIAGELKEAGLIRSKLGFEAFIRLSGAQGRILAGEHELNPTMNTLTVFDTITDKNKVNRERTIIIREGWAVGQIASYLESMGFTTRAQFFSAINMDKWRDQFDFLADAKGSNLEGYLFPDTYRVLRKTPIEEIIKKMLFNFDLKLTDEMRGDIKKQKKTIYDTVTLASIVEREAPKKDEDRKMIADVFLKRLAINMPLQADATARYLPDNPAYNTYTHRGLTPTPISNPGFASIEAVLYPIKNSFYYFLNDKAGNTYFAKTYREHQQNIHEYLDQ